MTDAGLVEIAENLRTRSPQRIWGLSPESVYTALVAVSATDSLKERLSPHLRAEMLRTNEERDHRHVAALHDWILDELGLVKEGEPTLLGAFVLVSENPQLLLRAIAAPQLQAAETVLRSCADIEESLPRREFDGLLADEWDETVLGPALGSFGFVTIYPDSVEPHRERIKSALAPQSDLSTERAVPEAYKRILRPVTDIDDERCIEDLVEEVVGKPPTGDSSPTAVAASLASIPPTVIDSTEIKDAVGEQREQYEEQFDVLRSLLSPSTEWEVDHIETDATADSTVADDGRVDEERKLLLNVICTVSAHPEFAIFDTEFVTERLPMTPYAVYQSFSSLPGVNCEVPGDGLVRFESLPRMVDREDLQEEYTAHLINRCSEVRSRIDALTGVSVSTPPAAEAADQMIAHDYESLDDGDVAPAYFTYTLINPDALGEKKMDDYVGDSRGLGREIAQLKRWHEERSIELQSYTAMTDRLFSIGLERDLDERILRIMTPFDDDTFNEYVAQIRRLLERGFELRLLTRHTKEPWEWRRLQRNLLSEIKEHRDQVTVRTYSRFKEHQRVTPNMDLRDLGELGIHGKLQTIGHPKEGAALLGSANFMENSYDWNPECGVYTERTQFVAAAAEFFDIVWDISGSDELAVARLQGIPHRQLIPTYYS